MAQKKKQSKHAKPFSPKQYLKEKARTLPIKECYWNPDWQEKGHALVVVARQHAGGSITYGIYDVDTQRSGVKEAKVIFSDSPEGYAQVIEKLTAQFQLVPIKYEEAHNLIYGAVAFAEEEGLAPCPDFQIAQYLLEEDTDDVPLIEYTFGTSRPDLKKLFTPQALQNLQKGLEILKKSNQLPQEAYSYSHPDYPQELRLKHPELETIFYDTKYAYSLPDELTDQLLALPHDELREDAEQIILYEIGRSADGIADERYDEPLSSPLMHALFFLGEIQDERSLPVVLEIAKQSDAFYEFYIGDVADILLEPTIYQIGRQRLDLIKEYMHTPGLNTFFRCHVARSVARIAYEEPARYEEIVAWFKSLLSFYEENLPKQYCCDGALIGMLTNDFIDMKMKELLPELRRLYDTGLIDEMCCGNYQKVEQSMLSCQQPLSQAYYPLDIHARYQKMKKFEHPQTQV